jgi:signal transduction histidine kinase
MILPPIWYWVITIFLIHSLKLTLFYKIWKDNIFILSISFLVYLGLACREGIMGLILHIDHYLWNSEMHFVSKEINYTFHMLKNELVKMEWCINNLNKAEEYNNREELRILEHSAGYIKQFISKNQFYSSKIILNLQNSSISELLRNAIVSFKNSNKYDIDFDCHLEADYIIPCDPVHLTEVFENLFHNAAESMKNNGKITVYLDNKIRRNMCMVMIRDEGCGITKKNLNKIFIPYFTTKKTNLNFGLGLSYCYNVIKKHKGHINVESKEGKGTTFYIYLQVK